jgi:hypothetical protein
MAVSARLGPATSTVYDRPASSANGTAASTAAEFVERTSPVAEPASTSTGCDARVLATPRAIVFPLTSRSNAPASGDALANRSRA